MYVITDGVNYINSEGGISIRDFCKHATKYPLWKANNVLHSIPQDMADRDWKIVEVSVSSKTEQVANWIINKKDEKRVKHFFEGWSMYSEQLGFAVPFTDDKIQTFWKALATRNRNAIIESFGCSNEEELRCLFNNI